MLLHDRIAALREDDAMSALSAFVRGVGRGQKSRSRNPQQMREKRCFESSPSKPYPTQRRLRGTWRARRSIYCHKIPIINRQSRGWGSRG